MFDNLEIRTLICKKDIEMGLNMVKSLRKYDRFDNVPIYFHDDGSLSIESKNTLLEIGAAHIVERDYADTNILEVLKNQKNCLKYRFDNGRLFNNTKMKLFDFYHISETKNILCIDSDILFLDEPKNMIELIDQSKPFYFPDFQNSYCFKKNKKSFFYLRNLVGSFKPLKWVKKIFCFYCFGLVCKNPCSNVFKSVHAISNPLLEWQVSSVWFYGWKS